MSESQDGPLGQIAEPPTPSEAPAPSSAEPTVDGRPPRALAARLHAVSPGVLLTVGVFVLINAVLLTGYLWSRGGQTIRVRVEARGNEFTGYVDGDLKARATFEAPAQGSLALSILNTGNIPSLPEPRGVDWVRVTDLRSGLLLFQDDFSTGYKQRWAVAGPYFSQDGVAGINGDGTLFLHGQSWTDYAVEVQYKNIVGAAVLLRAQDSRTGVVFSLRPFRQDDTSLALISNGAVVASAPGGIIAPARNETIKSMVAMVLRPYLLIFALLALAFVAVAALQFVPLDRVRIPTALTHRPDDLGRLPWLGAGAVTAGAFGVALFLMSAYTQRMAHVQDSATYVFQAKMLASGRLFGSPPPVPQVFDFETPSFMIVQHGKWASVYSFGHPLALAIGARFGAMWVVPPLLGGASIALIYAIGRKVYGARVGLLAAVLMASSPFFFMTTSEFMSHNTATFYLLASFFFLLLVERRPLLYGALAGLFFGLAFDARQLEAITLVLPFGLVLLSHIVRKEERKSGAETIAGFVAAGAVMLLAFLLYNYATRGGALNTGYAAAGFDNHIGFGGKHSVAMGIGNEQTQMALLLLVLNGWSARIGLLFVLLPFVLATRKLWDWFFLACAVLLIGVYTLYIGHGIMYGPRYWYPAAPFLMLIAARGADRAALLLAGAARSLRGLLVRPAGQPAWAGIGVVYVFVAVLIGTSISDWLLSRDAAWSSDFVPPNAISLQGFNQSDDRLVKLIEHAHLKNALVLVEPCTIWNCYGSVFDLNSTALGGDVVIARDVAARRAELLAAFPERRVYLASYEDRFLIPYGATPEPGSTPPAGSSAPVAKDIVLPPTPTFTPTVTPPATPTPDVAAPGRRDEQRRNDLAAIAAALQTYRDRNGTYPRAEGVQSVCRYRGLDAGCKLLDVVGSLPTEPTGGTYWYLSDGATYHLFAAMEQSGDVSQCPTPLLPDFASVQNLYCVASP